MGTDTVLKIVKKEYIWWMSMDYDTVSMLLFKSAFDHNKLAKKQFTTLHDAF